MRALPALMQSIIAKGVFLGENRPSARATVEPDWWLNTETRAGNWPTAKLPVRWWQRADNSQYELEIPNVMLIDIDTSIENAAGAATIAVLNQKMRSNISFEPKIPDELGQRGFYTFSRGDSGEARARWGQVPNDWNHVLVPNAMIRTYEGYGGHDKPLAQAVADGNVVLTGVWLVDDVTIGVGGKLELKCRDMIKLLIEQQLFPPLIPLSQYPLSYARWYYDNVALNAHGIDVGTVTKINPGDRSAAFSDSSVDHWYPQGSPGSSIAGGGYSIHGHRGADAFDGDDGTYWLGEGNSGADKPFAVNFLEVDCLGEAVNAIHVNPWGGGYTMYISVMENGVWQGTDVVPYDPSILFGTQPYAVDTGADVPYVSVEGVPWETPREYLLPRVYAATKVRISFRDLTDSGIGPWRYRAGVREFRVRIGAGGAQTGKIEHLDTMFLAAEAHPVSGYWTSSTFRQVDAFGAARVVDPSTPVNASNRTVWAIRRSPSGDGYYTMDDSGKVEAFGDAVHHGDLITLGISAGISNNPAIDMAVTPDGGGYWIVRSSGNVNSFGNATNFISFVAPTANAAICSCEGNGSGGLWIMDTAGAVHNYGSAGAFGSYSPVLPAGAPNRVVEVAVSIRRNKLGTGYWILTSEGRVQAKGGAPDLGGLTNPAPTGGDWRKTMWELITFPPADTGYLILKGDGTIFPIGTVDFYGGPASGTAQLRKDGNYKDLTDVVRDLLMWSGFFLQENLAANQPPSVFGALETTGTYLNDPIPTDLFDKHPVIDAINVIKDIVGYLIGCAWDGSVFFRSPNFWSAGNFDDLSNHTDVIPEIDELVDLTQYGIRATDRPVRSQLLISSTKIDPKDNRAQYVRYVPATAKLLRGMVKPAMWVDAHFVDEKEARIMAELIALRIWFQVRTGSVTAWNNPALGTDDQTRILERETSESWIHYISGKHTVNDVEAGTWIMQLTTNWLGDRNGWVITPDALQADDGLGKFQVSPTLQDWLRFRTGRPSLSRNLIDNGPDLTHKAIPNYTDEGDQAGPP